jgi:hypothetical protein
MMEMDGWMDVKVMDVEEKFEKSGLESRMKVDS